MDHFVSLDRLPDRLQFPPEFADRIAFGPNDHRLPYRGFMSKGDYETLFHLSTDWPYRLALEDLVRRCMADADALPRRGLRRVLSAVTGL